MPEAQEGREKGGSCQSAQAGNALSETSKGREGHIARGLASREMEVKALIDAGVSACGRPPSSLSTTSRRSSYTGA